MDDFKLKIPEHVSENNEFLEGYGTKECIQTVGFMVIGLIISFIIYLVKSNFGVIPIGLIISGGLGYFCTVKDRYSRTSFIDNVVNLKDYNKSQKRYYFRREKNEEEN